MDTETEDNNISYYSLGEKKIKELDPKLWELVVDYLKSETLSFKERFYLFEVKSKDIPICECGKGVKFIDMRSGFRKFCSKRCMLDSNNVKESRKKTNISKYGVDNPSKNREIREKIEKTNIKNFGERYPMMSSDCVKKVKNDFLDKYGVDNPSKIPEIREKAKKTMVEKWGVESAMNSREIKEDLKKFFLDKYGVDNPSKIPEIREKAKKTMVEKWGVEFATQNKDIYNNIKSSNLEKWGKEFYTQTDQYKKKIKENTFTKNKILIENLIESSTSEFKIYCKSCQKDFTIQRQLWRNRSKNNEEICLNCNPIQNSVSKTEKDILKFIQIHYNGEILENHRVENREIDIFLPELNIGFEYNGIYWHSELNKSKNYHSEKTNFFLSIGIQVIHIWEDDWSYRKDIVKSIILNKIGKSSKIFARKCVVKEIYDNSLIRNFLNENHIQGFIGSKIKIGLFFNGELISLMTFGGFRKSLGGKSQINSYEMVRFCSKLNMSVVGGASRLFRFFIGRYNPKSIISYSDTSRGVGNLYKKLGFNLSHDTPINYYWCKNGIRYHRFNFRKDKLIKEGFCPDQTEIEIMHSRDYYRVFDCGNKKWIYNI